MLFSLPHTPDSIHAGTGERETHTWLSLLTQHTHTTIHHHTPHVGRYSSNTNTSTHSPNTHTHPTTHHHTPHIPTKHKHTHHHTQQHTVIQSHNVSPSVPLNGSVLLHLAPITAINPTLVLLITIYQLLNHWSLRFVKLHENKSLRQNWVMCRPSHSLFCVVFSPWDRVTECDWFLFSLSIVHLSIVLLAWLFLSLSREY